MVSFTVVRSGRAAPTRGARQTARQASAASARGSILSSTKNFSRGSNPPATFQLQNLEPARAVDRNCVERCGEILAQGHQDFSNRRIESHEENDHCCFSESDACWCNFCGEWREPESLNASGSDRRRGRLADTCRPAVDPGERWTF